MTNNNMAESYVVACSKAAGAAAEAAASKKVEKYADLPASYLFQPIALESLGPINSSALDFLADLGRRISITSGEPREASFLFQRLSITLQRYNAILPWFV